MVVIVDETNAESGKGLPKALHFTLQFIVLEENLVDFVHINY